MSDAHPDAGAGGGAEQSHESRDLVGELRYVTAPPGPSPTWRSDESAALRETWLAFGELLDAAAPIALDQRELIESVRSRNARRGLPLSWSAVAAVAGGLAAALVIAIAISRSVRPGGPAAPEGVATSQRAPAPEATTRPPPPPAGLPPHAVASTRPQVLELAWDDRMGGRLEPVRRGVRRLQAGPNRHAERVDSLRARMSALQDDWSRNRL